MPYLDCKAYTNMFALTIRPSVPSAALSSIVRLSDYHTSDT
jgi:hypothetical protein